LAAANDRSVPRVAIDASADAGAVSRVIDAMGPSWPFPIAVRVRIGLEPDSAERDGSLDATLASAEAHGFRLWLATPVPSDVSAIPAWRARVQHWLALHRENVAVLEIELGDQAGAAARFAVAALSTDVRVAAPGAQLALSGGAIERDDNAAKVVDASLAPYVDLVAATSRTAADRALAALEGTAPDVRAVLIDQTLPDGRDESRAQLVDLQMTSFATRVVSVAVRGEAASVAAAVDALRPMAPLLVGDVDVLESAAASLRFAGPGGEPVDAPHRLLFDNRAFGTYLFYRAAAAAEPIDISVAVPSGGTPVIVDLVAGTRAPAAGFERSGQRTRVSAPRSGRVMLIDFNPEAADVFAERSDVVGARTLSVEEIVARHRLQQAAQDALVQHYAANVRMEQHFRPTVTDPGYDVVSDNRYFAGADGVEWEELSFAVNGSHWGANRPPFPLLQPEKVLSLPLQLQFGEDYRYRLQGTERVDGFTCYVVRFDPVASDRSLYRGTVWIDRKTFARVKVQAVQTQLSAPVVSNDEVQHYRPVTTIGGRPIFLFDGLTARQIVLIAGRNLLVEKSVAFTDFSVNAAGFDAARQAARASDRIMYRETDRGLRYYVKQGETRVVSDHATTQAKAMAMGVTVDPSFGFPLPIFGINYLNFAFRGDPNSQLAMLFAGVLAAINVQRPKIGHTPFDASLDLFGIAVPSSDRLYGPQGERAAERVITWPETTGLNLGWQATAFQKVSLQYQFRFDAYHKDTTTVDAFVVPTSTITNGIGGAYEYRRAGYSLVVNGAWYRRLAWKPWGLADDAAPGGGLEASQPAYARYSAGLSRDLYLGIFQKLHFNAEYFGGRNLDRFSRYQFGMFDETRIHGVPASGVRFDDLAMVRGSYTFNVFDQYRFDLFLEEASGRDRSASRAWQTLTGTGVALNVRAPFGTILRADIGYSFLPSQYRGIGSTVVQILFLKPLGSP
jgi:hypothetical protein